jgi:hypothetical protein
MFSEIGEKMLSDFNCCRISLCPRSRNNCLAAFGMNSGDGEYNVWLDRPPEFVTTLVSDDLPRASH